MAPAPISVRRLEDYEAKLLAAESREQVFQSIVRGGSNEADQIDVELFVRQARQVAAEARQRAPEMAWPVVASAYVGLANRLLAQGRTGFMQP